MDREAILSIPSRIPACRVIECTCFTYQNGQGSNFEHTLPYSSLPGYRMYVFYVSNWTGKQFWAHPHEVTPFFALWEAILSTPSRPRRPPPGCKSGCKIEAKTGLRTSPEWEPKSIPKYLPKNVPKSKPRRKETILNQQKNWKNEGLNQGGPGGANSNHPGSQTSTSRVQIGIQNWSQEGLRTSPEWEPKPARNWSEITTPEMSPWPQKVNPEEKKQY